MNDRSVTPARLATPSLAIRQVPVHRIAKTDAFEAVMAPLYPGLVRRLVLVVGTKEDAEDIAQEAYVRAFRAWDRFDGRDARAWIHTIALRLAFNRLERRRRWSTIVGRLRDEAWTDAADPDLWTAVRALEPRARATLLMHVLDGYRAEEIAAMLGEPVGTVSSRMSRARASLRRALGGPTRDG